MTTPKIKSATVDISHTKSRYSSRWSLNEVKQVQVSLKNDGICTAQCSALCKCTVQFLVLYFFSFACKWKNSTQVLPSDRWGEVSVQRRSKSIMQVFWRCTVARPKVDCLCHTTCSQNPDELVEVRIIFPDTPIKWFRQSLQRHPF